MIRKTLPLLFTCLIILHGHAQESAVNYLDNLNQHYKELNKDTWNYIKLVSRGKNAHRIDKNRIELISTLNKVNHTVSNGGTFEGDGSLRNAINDYLTLSIQTLNNDYKSIVDMEQIAEESYDDMEAYILTKQRVNAKMNAAQDTLRKAEYAFASKHNIKLVTANSKVSKKIKNANEIMSYYNKFYLIFYKSYWYENQLMTAVAEGNIGNMEQYRQTLAEISKASMDSVKILPGYARDISIKNTCHQMLYFYHGEAVRYMPDIIAFFVNKKEFEELAAILESKKPSGRTKTEINAYNEAVAKYNASIQTYNETTEYLSKFRE